MTRKEAIQKIKDLLAFKFEEVAAPVAEAKRPEVVEEVVTEKVEEVVTEKVEEVVTEEVKLSDNVDVAALQTEIADLRQKVSVMSDYVQLKDQYNYLKKCMDQMTAGFSAIQQAQVQTLALVETIADEPTAEPAQTPKDSLVSKKSKLEKYFPN